MKDLKKRLVALVVCLCLALSLMPASALAYIGAMDYLDLSADTYADNDFIYLENSSLRFMIERDYGHGMLLWTSDEVVGWGQGVQEMRFTIQYPDQEEREMNVTRLEQRYGQGTIWLIYHFGNDHYQTPGDVEITYEAEITLVPLDSGAATGMTGQYINYNADGKNNWGVLIKGEFEYDSDSVTFDLGGELDQVGATARVRTTFEGFPNMGHETYQNQEAPVSVMLSSYTYDDNYYNYGRIHTATNISRGLGMTSTYDGSDYGGITEIYTSGYAWANPFIATSNFYYQDTGYSYETSEENPKGIAGYPDRNENLGVDDPIYDQRDKRGRSLNLPSYVSYSPGNTSGECVVTTVSEATMLGYKSGDGVTVYDSDMASLLYGYRNLVNMDTMPTRPSDRDDVNVSADADRLAIWYEGDTVRVEPVLGESEVPDNAVAVFRGTFEETEDGAGYRFINGVAALSPTVTATWTGYEASNWALIVNKNGTISVDGYVNLNAPSFKFYQASDTSNEADNLKLEITKDGIKMTMTPSNNSAVPYVDIPNTKVALESGIIKRDGSLEFSGKLSFNHFFANSALDMTRLAYGYNGSQFTIFGVEATGNIQKTELAGLELGSVSGDINTFSDNNTFDFNAELDVFSLFKAQAVLNFSRMDNGELMPDDIYFNVDSKVGIPITPPAPLAKLKGGGAGIYNLATTINGDWYAIPPILLRGTVDTEIINLLTGTADATIGPSQIELVGRDIKIKALGNLKVIEEVGVGVYLGAQTITNDNISYTGGSFNGEIWLKAGLPSVSMNFIKMDNALSLGVFGGVSSNPMQALLRVTGNAKSDVEIQFPDRWPVIGGWNLLGAELNAAAGAQTVVPFTGSVGSIFEESFNNLDIYLGVAATASLLGSDGRVWVIYDSNGSDWGYDYKLAGELPEWSWEGIIPFSASGLSSSAEASLMSVPVPANAAATTVVVEGVTGEQSGYILLAFDESITEKQLRSGLSVSKGEQNIELVWPEWTTDDDGNPAIKNGDEMTAVSRVGTNQATGEKERVVMIYVGDGEAANGSYTVTLPDGVTAVNGSYDAVVSPLDKLGSSIEASTTPSEKGTITSSVVNPEQDATYVVRTYLGEEYGGADYLLDERVVSDADLSDGELNFTIDVALSGTSAPSGTYYPTIFLMREETMSGDDGTEQKVLVAIDSKSSGSTQFTYANSNAPSSAPNIVNLTAIGNENMTASWSAVDGADGYKIVIYEQDDESKWVDTGLGYEYDAEQFVSTDDDYISGLRYDEDTGYSIDMAMTVGGADSEDGAVDTLEAGKDYKVGVTAYNSGDITTGGETQSVKYYGPEKQSDEAYLPEYTPQELEITYNDYPLKTDENGIYTHFISELDDGDRVRVSWQSYSSSNTYSCEITRTDTGDSIPATPSQTYTDFALPEFCGTLPLRIEFNITHTVDGVRVTDTTVKYLTIILDDVAPVVTFDEPYYYADSDGSFTATGMTDPGAVVRFSLPPSVTTETEVYADEDGRFKISGKLTDGDGLMVVVESLDAALNTGTASTIVTAEPEAPVTPDPDPDPEPDDSDSGGSTTYPPTIADTENGKVTVSPSRPSRGQTVTITAEPDEGFEVDEVVVTDRNGDEIEITDKGSGKWSFTQPRGRVTITVTFRAEGGVSDCRGDETCPMYGFEDLDMSAWYHDGIHYCIEHGLMNGVSDSSFAPNDTTTRAQIVTLLYRLEGEPDVDNAIDFTDVPEGEWYSDAVRWAAGEDIVEGYGNGLFGTNDPVTREQLAAIFYRYAVCKGYDVSIGEDTNILSYEDFSDLSEYAIPAMQWACGTGIVNGTSESTLEPQGNATRAQIAAILMRFCENAAQ